MNCLLTCFLVLTVITSTLATQTDRPFTSITLDQPLPPLFRVGELFNFKGKIDNLGQKAHLVVDTKLIDGDYSELFSKGCCDSTFSFFLNFKLPGIYYLNVALDNRHQGTKMLIVHEPDTLIKQPVESISELRTLPTEESFSINWQSMNELIQMEVIQNEKMRHYLLSNKPQSFTLDPEDFQDFSADLVNIRVRGARSNTGSYYAQSSEWGDWVTLEKTLVPWLEPIKEKTVQFLKPYYCLGDIDSLITIEIKTRDHFDLNAYLRRPDGLIDVVPLASYKKRKFTVAGSERELGIPGNCVLEYTPRIEGTYLIEINDDEGFALINVPFYCGKALPLIKCPELPLRNDTLNLDLIRISVLEEINKLRTQVGLGTLQLDSTLNQIAQYYSDKMAREEFCGHVSPSGQTALDRKKRFDVITQLSENVARANTPECAFASLIHSPAHYAAMIDTLAERAGFGVEMGADSTYYVTQYFSPNPRTREQLDQFIDELYVAMKAEKKKLVRIYEKDEWPAQVARIYTAPTLERLRRMILVDSKLETWKLKSIQKVYFVGLEEKMEGFVLSVKFYSKVEKRKK
ncbi:CAP domain-containing protein [candidate division KSB1 bacterium]|nr:CAP domain-containing protein [candidate division KSB1 bacterium]